MKNQIHIQTKPGQPRRECKRPVARENQIHIPTTPGQPRRECQRPVAREKSNLRTG